MKFKLVTDDGETINKCEAVSIHEARRFFSLRKDLSVGDLTMIYNVFEDK